MQRLATMVIVGLVALSTILVLYLADEGNRIKAEEQEQQDAAIERAEENYISLCLPCHGPAGEGYTEGTGRLGAPLGGPMTSTNQQGINAQGTPVPGGVDGRATVIASTIHNGRGAIMPKWGDENGGPLNFDQINELVVMIQHVDWNQLYNKAIEESGGYPTVPPTAGPTQAATPAPSQPGTYEVDMEDIKFSITELTLPANTDVTINLKNAGASVHNFNIDDLNVHSGDYQPGQTGTVTFKTGAAGTTYEFYCNIPGHKEAGMDGKITVSDQAAPAAGQPAPAGSPTGGNAGVGGAQTTFDVKLQDIHFDVSELDVPANTDITVNATNEGASAHNFTIPDLNVTTGDLQPGESKTITFNSGAAGEHQYLCTIPGHKEAGMVGTLKVSDQAAAPAQQQPAGAATSAPANGGAATSGGAQTTFNVKLEDIKFDVTELDVPANTDITVNVTNEGSAAHNFTIPDLNVTTGDLAAGESKTITFNSGAAGTHEYECTIPGHKEAGMVGTLKVS